MSCVRSARLAIDDFADRCTRYRKAFSPKELYRIWYCTDLTRRGIKMPIKRSRALAEESWATLTDERIAEFHAYADLTRMSSAMQQAKPVIEHASSSASSSTASGGALLLKDTRKDWYGSEGVFESSTVTDMKSFGKLQHPGEDEKQVVARLPLPLSPQWYEHYMQDRFTKKSAEEFELRSTVIASVSSKVPDQVEYGQHCLRICNKQAPKMVTKQKSFVKELHAYRMWIAKKPANVPAADIMLAFEIFPCDGRPLGTSLPFLSQYLCLLPEQALLNRFRTIGLIIGASQESPTWSYLVVVTGHQLRLTILLQL